MLERTRDTRAQDVERKRTQRRTKSALATGLLLIAVAIFVALRFFPNPGFFTRLLNAAAEASIVGGLADWFAITALFRRPLGLPIPHTALVPSRKDEIGRSLGNFVRDQFLDPELLTERLRRQNRALQIAEWLDTEEAAHFFAERAVILVPPLLESLNDSEVRTFLARLAESGLKRIDLVAKRLVIGLRSNPVGVEVHEILRVDEGSVVSGPSAIIPSRNGYGSRCRGHAAASKRANRRSKRLGMN